MSPRARIYTIVAVIAAAAAGTVVAVTALTANHPPGPRPGKPPFAADWTAHARAVAAGSGRGRLGLGAPGARESLPEVVRSFASTSGSRSSGGGTTQPRSPLGSRPSGRSRTLRRLSAQATCSIRTRPAACRRSRRASSGRRRRRSADWSGGCACSAAGGRSRPSGSSLLLRRSRPGIPTRRLPPLSASTTRIAQRPPLPVWGPLVRRFPHAQTVRFHLGLLSIWIGAFDQARRELRLAVAEGPKSPFAREARTLLKRLENVRTK